MPLDLAVIVVTWNVRDLALEALRTLRDDLQESGLRYIVYVVDSASSDGTAEAIAEKFPDVALIACDENVGFVRGNNMALRAMGFDDVKIQADELPRAVYLLNPDTITQPGSTRALFDALLAREDVGIVGANLTYGDGTFQHGAFAMPGLRQLLVEFFPVPGRLIEGRFNGRYPRSQYVGTEPFSVGFVLGAAMMVKREAISRVGLLDEGFFMYCEEIDWAWRIHRAGWQAQCVPKAHVIHLGGQSSGQVRARTLVTLWRSRLRLFRKIYPAWKLSLSRWLIRLGAARKRRLLAHDSSLTSTQRDELTAAYTTIIELARS